MYLGNPNLRAVDQEIEYTKEMIEEVIRCKEDIIYFAEKYFTIVTIDEGKKLIELFDFQKKILKQFVEPQEYRGKIKQNSILRIPRQQGKCIFKDSIVKLRNKKTGEIKEIAVKDIYFGR